MYIIFTIFYLTLFPLILFYFFLNLFICYIFFILFIYVYILFPLSLFSLPTPRSVLRISVSDITHYPHRLTNGIVFVCYITIHNSFIFMQRSYIFIKLQIVVVVFFIITQFLYFCYKITIAYKSSFHSLLAAKFILITCCITSPFHIHYLTVLATPTAVNRYGYLK